MRAFVVCALAMVVAMVVAVSADDVYTRAGHEHDVRERLGHFKEKPFIDLYKHYAASFVLPLHPERDTDDYRNYMPSSDECVIFLKQYRAQSYKLRDLDQMVVLDACLGYLYDEGAQEHDEERKELKQFAEFPELKDLYAGTRVNELSEEGKECVADLLVNVITAKNQFKDVLCNNHFLQVFLQFAECQQKVGISKEQREGDSYLAIVYELVKKRVHDCVDIEAGHIEVALRNAYGKRKVNRLTNSIRSRFSSIAAEQKQRMWPREVTRLLSAFQNTTHQVNIREVHQLIRGVVTNDEPIKEVLLKNMAKFADAEIKPKLHEKTDDRSGLKRYNSLIDGLCNYFRSSDRESQYDFATPIIRLNQLLAHRDLFDITPEQFVKKFLTHAKETAPVYLSVQACNILSFTEGLIDKPVANSKQFYNVVFVPDTSKMILWPVANYY